LGLFHKPAKQAPRVENSEAPLWHW